MSALPPGWKMGYRESNCAFADTFYHSEDRSLTAETPEEAWLKAGYPAVASVSAPRWVSVIRHGSDYDHREFARLEREEPDRGALVKFGDGCSVWRKEWTEEGPR